MKLKEDLLTSERWMRTLKLHRKRDISWNPNAWENRLQYEKIHTFFFLIFLIALETADATSQSYLFLYLNARNTSTDEFQFTFWRFSPAPVRDAVSQKHFP